MALKDWKQTQDEPLVYVKKSNRNRWLGMREVDGVWHTILPNGTRRKFENKEQAEIYIMNYMRTH